MLRLCLFAGIVCALVASAPFVSGQSYAACRAPDNACNPDPATWSGSASAWYCCPQGSEMSFINGQFKCAGSGSCQGPPCSACTTSEGCQSDSIPAGETRLSGSFQCPLDSIPKLERLHFHSPDGSTLIATTFNQATPSSSQVNYPAASSSGAVSCFLVDTAGGTPIGAATPNPLVDNSIRVSFTCKNVFQACPISGAISFSCINPCEPFLTCSTCKAAANCGWCQTSGQCLYGSSNGAYSNTSCKASANNWLYTNAQTCPSTVVKRDGGWGGWSSCFSDCKQVRTCNNPTPANGGSTWLELGVAWLNVVAINVDPSGE